VAVDSNARYIFDATNKLNTGNLRQYSNVLPETTGFEKIFAETSAISSHSSSFSDNCYSYEVVRFSWIWVQIFFTIIALVFALVGFKKKGAQLLMKIGIIWLFALFASLVLFLAFMASEIFVVLDVCENVYNIVHLNQIPTRPTGLAYFLAPFTYVIFLFII